MELVRYLQSCMFLAFCSIQMHLPHVSAVIFDTDAKGESGEICTDKGDRCLSYAKCENGKCVCPPGWKGDGRVECVVENDHLCTVLPKFRVRAFGGAGVQVRYPCTNRLATFTVEAVEGETSCAIDVIGIPVTYQTETRVQGFFATITIVDKQDPEKSRASSTLKVGVSLNGFFNFRTETDMYLVGTGDGWGEGAHWTWRGVSVSCAFDKINNFAVLTIPKCSTRIKYRPYSGTDVIKQERPEQLPAVTIQAPRRAKWDPESDKGLCGTPDNGHGLWRFTKAKLKVPTQAEAALYTILTQGVSNFPIIYPVCKLPEKSFSACPNYRRPYAIRLCSQFFAPKSAFFKCMLNNGCHAPALIFMFDHCIRYACKGIPKDCLVVQNKLALVPKCIKFAGPELGKIDCRRGIEDLPV